MTSLPTASAVVRAKNEAEGIQAALRSLRQQDVEVEVVVVDSGSTDGTRELAEPLCDRLVQIAPGDFTFGRSLNIGTAATSGAVIFALSAHCTAPDTGWVRRALEHYADPRVAGTSGQDFTAEGRPLSDARRVTRSDVLLNPHWGFSNTASSWRRSVWDDLPFNEALPASEDKEWMWRVLQRSLTVVIDPSLNIRITHRRSAGLRALWRREVAEHAAIAAALAVPVPSAAATLRAWWSEFPYPSTHPRWQRRLSPMRNAEIFGGFVGDRIGRSRRGTDAISLIP